MFKLTIILIFLFSTSSSSLSIHSTRRFAHKALLITSNRAHEVSSYISHVSQESRINEIMDCRSMLERSVERLDRSIKEMVKLGAYGSSTYETRVGNARSWVSAALTEQEMCLQGLQMAQGAGGGAHAKVIKLVAGMVSRVRKFTSDALSLLNRL